MSIRVEGLTKIYGTQKAVDNISFEVKPGEIMGFLGPNGAGKSTTMKIITGYIPCNSGFASVCDVNVMEDSSTVRRLIGYLPEHNPLYSDMYVHEFLEFIGRIHGFRGKSLKDRIGEMISLCGLKDEQNKIIETLSKGYKQRVGLAQALFHDPEVLILDEPTTGLDPNQILEIRKLIRKVSETKTVLFSTHIMQEVQALCERVAIISKGKLVANDSLDVLTKGTSVENKLELEIVPEIDHGILESIEGVNKVISLGNGKYEVYSLKDFDIRPMISRKVSEAGSDVVGMKLSESSMESVFQELTREEVDHD